MAETLVLRACPFCGELPGAMPWPGGGKRKRNIMCREESCPIQPSVCGDTFAIAAERWNARRVGDAGEVTVVPSAFIQAAQRKERLAKDVRE